MKKRTFAIALAAMALSCANRIEPKLAQGPPLLSDAASATYHHLQTVPGQTVTLVNGKWEGEPAAPGASARPGVDLVPDFHLIADLDGDGSSEMVVLIAERGGGTGEITSLAVLDRMEGTVRNTATATLGDRVQLKSLRADQGMLVADLVQTGSDDAACCPGDIVERKWSYSGEKLTESGSPVSKGRLGPDVLAGSEWVLRSWQQDETVPAEPRVTLTYKDGQFLGRGGCNRYFAKVQPGKAPGDLSVGPVGATKMACLGPGMAIETRYFQQLDAVTKFGFLAGRLALTYRDSGGLKVMLFEPAEAGQ